MSLKVVDLSVTLGSSVVLSEITAEFRVGLNMVIGPNGAGKSTLLKAVAGLVSHQGSVSAGTEQLPKNKAQRSQLVSYLPQRPTIVPGVDVVSYVMLGRAPYRGSWSGFVSQDFDVASEALEQVGCRHLQNQKLTQLSGGQQQLVVLARLLCQQTPVVLLDEPASQLDIGWQQKIMVLLSGLAADKTVICVSHDLDLAAQFADRLYLIAGGKLVRQGKCEAVYQKDLLSEAYQNELQIDTLPGGNKVVRAV